MEKIKKQERIGKSKYSYEPTQYTKDRDLYTNQRIISDIQGQIELTILHRQTVPDSDRETWWTGYKKVVLEAFSLIR